jgi:hypothetical protein
MSNSYFLKTKKAPDMSFAMRNNTSFQNKKKVVTFLKPPKTNLLRNKKYKSSNKKYKIRNLFFDFV